MNASASIVLYNSNSDFIIELVNSLTSQGVDIVYLVDNSKNDSRNKFNDLQGSEYLHYPSNPGFGKSHNKAIEKAIHNNYKFHFIVNPDIYLGENVINRMVGYISQNENIGMMMPQILNLDGSIQYLPKLLPSPISLIKRKISIPFGISRRFIEKYEMRLAPPSKIYNCPIISGCFCLLNLDVIQNHGAYDERFFMYFEDFDLSRRLHRNHRTLYFPDVYVYHGYDSGANRNSKLLFAFILSAIKYFNKWGWFWDSERNKFNARTLSFIR